MQEKSQEKNLTHFYILINIFMTLLGEEVDYAYLLTHL